MNMFSWWYGPVFWFGFILSGAWLVGNREYSMWLLAALLPVAILVSTLAEHFRPYEREWNRSVGDLPRDLAHASVNEFFNALGLCLLPLLAIVNPLPSIWPSHWPFLVQLLIAILIADLGITLIHFCSHRVHFLWRFHAVHHSIRRMYGFNGLMKHRTGKPRCASNNRLS